jgi:flagellar hook assembly protein FlgD
MGQKVRTLVKGSQLAGFKEINWEGKDDFGNRVASGFYFYNIKIKTSTGITFKDNRKMLMIK